MGIRYGEAVTGRPGLRAEVERLPPAVTGPGRYFKDLPKELTQRYIDARVNPRLLSLADDIAVSEARLRELLGQVGTGESGASWRSLQEALAAFQEALAVGDMGRMQREFERMQRVITRGNAATETWREIGRLWETRLKLVQTEMKTLQGLQQMVTEPQLRLYLGAITEAVTRVVQEQAEPGVAGRILRAIMAEFTRISSVEEAR